MFTNSKGQTYFLHRKQVDLRNGQRTLYFFSKERKEGAIDEVPEGYEISEGRNGLPVLRKSDK
jgi:hypothetical protein